MFFLNFLIFFEYTFRTGQRIMHFKNIFIVLFLLLSINGFSVVDSLQNINRLQEAKYYYTTGIKLGRAGKLDSALIYSLKASNLFENIDNTDSTLLANSYQSLGIINKLLGKYDEAIKCYDKAEKIYLLEKKANLLAYIYGNKANIYYIQQDFSKSKDYHLRSLNIFLKDSAEFKSQISSTYNNLGNVYKKSNDLVTAINYYKKSLILKENNKSRFTTLSNLACCYEQIKKFETADKYYQLAIEIIKKNYGEDNIWLAYQKMNYGRFLANQKKNEEKVKDLFRSSLEIYKRNYGLKNPDLSEGYNSIGKFYLTNNQLDSALFYFQKSLIAISPEFNDTSISSNPEIGHVLSKTHLLSSLKNKAYVLSKIALQNKSVSNYELSLKTYDLAVKVINKIRSGYLSEESKLFLANNEFETYSNALEASYALYHLTNEEKYIEKAFNYSESGRSAVLTEALKNNNALNIGGIPDSLINKEKGLEKSIWNYEELIYEENKKKNPDKNKLAFWNKYLFEKKHKFDDLTRYLENNFHEYYVLKHQNNLLPLSKIQKELKHNDLLVEYFLTKDELYTILLGKNGSNIIKQNIGQLFYDNLDNLLASLSNNNFSNHGFKEFKQYQETSLYIYNILLKPIENRTKNKNLIIIPDGKLAYLPFEVLTTHDVAFKRINYKGLPYLLYNNHISYSYSASFLFDNKHTKQTAERRLGAFAPTYKNINALPDDFTSFRQEYREKLFPLKGIKIEVEKITELLNGDEYLDYDANEKTFKKVAPLYDILHLAMHTIIDDKNPMYSKMAFTQENDSVEDGFLNTYELYNMKLNSRMAVLSSCNSGNGKLQRGEGVMSLARGFFYSGCPSIVMTLWSVEDKSGVKLMSSFYKNLLMGKTKSEALQESKIDFIKHADQLKSHPYFWSGYVVIGSNNALFESHQKLYILFGVILVALGISLFYFIRLKKTNKESLK